MPDGKIPTEYLVSNRKDPRMTGPSADALRLHAQATVIDLHAHPSLKTYFGSAELKRRQKSKKGFNLTRLRTSYPSLVDGGVDVLCSCIAVPERQLKKDCLVIAAGEHLQAEATQGTVRTGRCDDQGHVEHVEAEVKGVNGGAPVRPMEVVRSNAELDQALGAEKMALVHMIEGGHSLASNPFNVGVFKQLGVAMITLAHFYPNDVAAPVDAALR